MFRGKAAAALYPHGSPYRTNTRFWRRVNMRLGFLTWAGVTLHFYGLLVVLVAVLDHTALMPGHRAFWLVLAGALYAVRLTERATMRRIVAEHDLLGICHFGCNKKP